MEIAARHEPDQRPGTENEQPGGPLITACILRALWLEGRRKVLKATRFHPAAAPASPANTSSRQTHAFHFPPFFPSFSSAPRVPDRTPRLPSARCPLADRAQRGSPETREKGHDGIPSRAWKPGGPSPPAAGGAPQGPRDPSWQRSRRAQRFFFSFLQGFLVERGGKKLPIHVGQGSVGQRIKPENRLFELSGRKKDCPGTQLK